MNDTRETLVSNLSHLPREKADNELDEDIPEKDRPKPRFKVGDILVAAYALDEPFRLLDEPRWDYEFSGWLMSPGLIAVHESNFIKLSEIDDWSPHKEGLWSYWMRKNPESGEIAK